MIPHSDYFKIYKDNEVFFTFKPYSFPFVMAEPYEKYFEVERGDTVVDVGAHIGKFAIPSVKKVGKEGSVVAIEPEPQNLKLLRKNLSDFSNVSIIEKAVWKEKGKIRLYLGGDSRAHTAVPNVKSKKGERLSKGETYLNVQSDILDNIVSGINNIDFLKMDIEGAEIEALSGAEQTLQKTNKIAIASYHHRKGEATAARVKNILDSHDFKTLIGEEGLVYGSRELSI